jgi:RNA polymerase sigma factor (sigma-70 family)
VAHLTPEEIESLITSHEGYARKLARKAISRYPPNVTVDDLEAEALEALRRAAERFDPERGAKFSTFIYRRIHGSFKDAARKYKWFPEPAAETTFEPRAHEYMEAVETSGEPAPLTAAERRSRIANLGTAIATVYMVSLGSVKTEPGDNAGAELEQRTVVANLLAKLEQGCQELIRRRFFDDATLEEIAAEQNVLRPAILKRVRKCIDRLRHLFFAQPETAAAR